MAFHYGFYNSSNGDRKYNATDFGMIFDGIISDGVFPTYGNGFKVTTSTEKNTVTVQSGRAWFNHTWNYNDANLLMVDSASESVLDRIDALVIDVNTNVSYRKNSIIWVKGTPASSPARPTLTNTTDHFQYPLCYVYRTANTDTIAESNITNMIGTTSCPYAISRLTPTVYCTCATAAATAAKVATIDGGGTLALTPGTLAYVKFTYSNTASNCTLNIGGTGAKSIWYNTGAYTGTSNGICGYANRTYLYQYDGTYWVFQPSGADVNTTYSPATLGQGYGTCATAAATAAKVVTLASYKLITGGIVAVKFTYDVPASATMNINSAGAKPIYAYGAAIKAGVIKAGDLAFFMYDGTDYHLIGIDTANSTIATLVARPQTVYCTCATEAATAAKVATIDDGSTLVLRKGTIAFVKFTNTNSASSCTLNVGGTGAKSIWVNNSVYASNSYQYVGYANRVLEYVYDGTYWVWEPSGVDANTTYSPATLGQGYGTCATAAATAAKVVTLASYKLITGGIVAVKFTYDVPASATMNINSAGAKPIYAYGAAIKAGVIKAGDLAFFMYDGTDYHLMGVDQVVNTTYSPATLGQGYGTCATAAATAAKVVTLASYKLVTGGIVAVKFTYNVPASATMNINSAGAKPIYAYGAAIKAGVIKAGDLAFFMYDGTDYHLMGVDALASGKIRFGIDSDGNYGYIKDGADTVTPFKTGKESMVGDATAANVLSGKTFTNASSVGISGTMTNNGAKTAAYSASTSAQTYTIPAGYHNGSGKITFNAVSATKTLGSTNGTAVDMGGAYRYVNTNAVYNAGYNAGISEWKSSAKLVAQVTNYTTAAWKTVYTASKAGTYVISALTNRGDLHHIRIAGTEYISYGVPSAVTLSANGLIEVISSEDNWITVNVYLLHY